MTDQEAHDALAKMAQEHARGAVPVDGEPQDFPEPEKTIQVDVPAEYGRGPQKLPAVDLTPEARDSLTIGEPKRVANPTMEMPEMDLTDSKTAAAPFTVNGEVGKLATGAAVPPKPRLDLSQPIGAPSSRRPDTELAGLQDDAKRRRQTGQLGQAVTDSIERPSNFLDYAQRLGGGGVSAPAKKSTLWQDYEEEGGRAISEIEQRRKADGAMAAKDEAQDPNSATAKIYRAALLKFAPDLQLDTATPAQMVTIAPWLESYAKDAKVSRGDPLEQAKLDETIRHNQMTEKQIHGHVPGQKAAPVVAGKYDSISDAGERETVRAIVEGRAPAPAPGSKSGQHIMALVAQIDPSFDSTKFGTYQHARAEQSTNPALIAIKTAYKHMDEALSSLDDLGNSNSPTWNKVANWASAATGDAKTNRARTALQAVGSEAARAYGENDVEGRQHVHELTDMNQSPAQIRANLNELKTLLAGKEEAFGKNLDDVKPMAGGGQGGGVLMHKKGFAPQLVPGGEVEEAGRAGWEK